MTCRSPSRGSVMARWYLDRRLLRTLGYAHHAAGDRGVEAPTRVESYPRRIAAPPCHPRRRSITVWIVVRWSQYGARSWLRRPASLSPGAGLRSHPEVPALSIPLLVRQLGAL